VLRPVATTFAARVAAPLEKVFALLTDPARIPQWLPGCRDVSPHTPIVKGSRLTVRFPKTSTTFEIVELTPPTGFGWADREGRPGSQTYFKLEFGGSMTVVTMKDVWTPQSLGHLLRGRFLSRRNTRRMFEGMIDNLRNLAMK
jgi:uncharacterized protein YndB with AHSA1/START domain